MMRDGETLDPNFNDWELVPRDDRLQKAAKQSRATFLVLDMGSVLLGRGRLGTTTKGWS
jgi:hypothetical protein